MKDTLKLGLTLFAVCAISALVLAFSNNMTKGIIEEQALEESLKNVKEIFGDDKEFVIYSENDLNEIILMVPEITSVYKVSEDGNKIGYAFSTSVNGYKPDLSIMTGITQEGKIKGVRVLSHQETKGIGTKALSIDYLDKFKDLSLYNIPEIDSLSGATRTSVGIKKAIDNSFNAYEFLVDKEGI